MYTVDIGGNMAAIINQNVNIDNTQKYKLNYLSESFSSTQGKSIFNFLSLINNAFLF